MRTFTFTCANAKCGKKEEVLVIAYGKNDESATWSMPVGWFRINQVLEPQKNYIDEVFCSCLCLVDWLTVSPMVVPQGSGALEYVRETLYGFQGAASETTDFSEGLPRDTGLTATEVRTFEDNMRFFAPDNEAARKFTASELNYGADKTQPPKGSFIRITDTWTCDNHTDPITYTDGTTECYCGNVQPKE